MVISVAAATSAIYFARHIYLKNPAIADKISSSFKGIYNLLLNKYFVDEVYEASIVNPIVKGSENILWKFTDNILIDGLVNAVAKLIGMISDNIKKIQTGVAQAYALVMVLGILIAIFWIIMSHS
jgi:NADH-quinone oxidoreductase subunit L